MLSESRLIRHVISPHWGEASSKPRSLSLDRIQAISELAQGFNCEATRAPISYCWLPVFDYPSYKPEPSNTNALTLGDYEDRKSGTYGMQNHAETALISLHRIHSGNRWLTKHSRKATKLQISLCPSIQVSKWTQKIRKISCKAILHYKINRFIYGIDV